VLLPQADPSAIASVLDRYLADRAALLGLGDRAATWAADNLWSWDERMAAEVERLEALMTRDTRSNPAAGRH
jgi:hypothetical protein